MKLGKEPNHYDRFTVLEAENILSDEGLVETHAKFSEALTDPYVHDAAKIVVELVEEIQRLRSEHGSASR